MLGFINPNPMTGMNYNINIISITESFNTNITHQLFDYKITSVNSQLENTNSKSDFVFKTGYKRSF